jgi:hypothetical protein
MFICVFQSCSNVCVTMCKRLCSGTVTEVDVLRIIVSSTCSLLRRFPDALVQVCTCCVLVVQLLLLLTCCSW